MHCDIDETSSSVVPTLGVSSLDLGRSATPDGLFSLGMKTLFCGQKCSIPLVAVERRTSAGVCSTMMVLYSAAAQHIRDLQARDLVVACAHSGRFLPRLGAAFRGGFLFPRAYSAAARRSAEGVNSANIRRHKSIKSACKRAKRAVGCSETSSRYSARFISICSACTPVCGRP